MSAPLLELGGVSAFYGQAQILEDVSFAMGTEAVAIIGRNGMGKSTLCNAIMGMVPQVKGSLRLDGVELLGKPSYRIAGAGIGYVPATTR